MKMPFTTDEFFTIFEAYNRAVWPAQIAAYLLGVVMLLLLLLKVKSASTWASAGLALMWAWTGIVYHIVFFRTINPIAIAFGILFLLQAILILRAGVLRQELSFQFPSHAYGWIGVLVMLYAGVIYPLLGSFSGHSFPRAPAFGITPCPLSIFTFGLLLWIRPPLPFHLLIIPVLWALFGSSAAFALGVREDLGMLAAAILVSLLIAIQNHGIRTVRVESAAASH